MPEKICPICEQPYVKRQEFTEVIVYHHSPTEKCEQHLTMAGHPNEAESTPSGVLRRKRALKSKRVR